MTTATLPPSVTSSLDQRRHHQQRLLTTFLAVSTVAHLACFAVYALWPRAAPPAIDLDAAVIKTRLVKLGKERDKSLLPRLPTSPPPPAADKSRPTPDKPTPDKPDPSSAKQPSAADILEKFNQDNAKPTDVRDLIKNRIGEETDEGKKDGDKDGTDLTGEIQATYFQRVIGHIHKHMQLSKTLSDDELIRLKAVLVIKIDGDGNVIDAQIQKTSGSVAYDNDVISAAKQASPVPAPPPQVRALVEKGVGINFCPTTCS